MFNFAGIKILKFKNMKKLLSLLTLSLLIGLGVVKAQNQRIVVLECFTSTTCGPCASANPALDALINNNEDKLIAIKYHVNWPAAGDPMNVANPSDVSSKVSYYGIQAVPYSVGNGTWVGNSGNVSQALVNQWAAAESPVDMRMTHYLNEAQDTMFIVVMGRALSDVSSNNLKLNVSVIEKTMEYATAPGSNGERIFHNVMKKLLPRPSGESIPALATGDYFAFKYAWPLNYVFDVNELTAVAWLQDGTSKAMHQGCKSTDNFQAFYAKQAVINKVEYTKEYVCTGTMDPHMIIDNLGSETINTMKINVYNNGEVIKTINWEGSILPARSERIHTGLLTFDVAETNNISFEIELINGAPDDYATSVLDLEVKQAELVVNKSFKLYIKTSDEPQLNTWEITDANSGEVILSGGPYDEPGKIYTEEFDLTGDGCYMVTVYDNSNNGSGSGSMSFSLKGGSKTLFTCANFTNMKSNEFSFEKNDDVIETAENSINVYPNPTSGMITVEAEGENEISVYSITGQAVKSLTVNGKATVDLSSLDKGVYMMVLTNTQGETMKQMIVLQ